MLSSSTSPSETLPISRGGNRQRSTRKRRALSWGDMPQGAPWDLTDSLSNLTQNMADVPILDISKWVRRSVEERRRETQQKGMVPRPMNPFMLYRLAYTESIIRLSARRNPQVISSIAGKSWWKETQGFRDEYARLSKIERDGHVQAHPDYKFKRKLRKRPSVAEPVALFESPELSENSNCGWPPVQDFGASIQSPIDYPYLGSHPEGILENHVEPMGGVFQGGYSSGLVGLPDEAHHDLLCPEPINPTTSIFIDGSYVDPQWQESLWFV